MRITYLFLLIFISFLFSCDSTEMEPQFEPEFIDDLLDQRVSCDSKEGLFFVFTATETKYSISISEIDYDLDLTFGEYDDSDQFEDQKVISVSKNPGDSDEAIEVSLEPGVEYLVEVFNYSHLSSSGRLIISHD